MRNVIRSHESADDDQHEAIYPGAGLNFQSFWTMFLSKLQAADRVPPGGGTCWVSAYVAQSSRRGGVYLTFGKTFEHGLSWFSQLEADAEAIEREVGTKMQWERADEKVFLSVPTVVLGNRDSPLDLDRVTWYLADMTSKMMHALKSRLAALAASLVD